MTNRNIYTVGNLRLNGDSNYDLLEVLSNSKYFSELLDNDNSELYIVFDPDREIYNRIGEYINRNVESAYLNKNTKFINNGWYKVTEVNVECNHIILATLTGGLNAIIIDMSKVSDSLYKLL